MPNVYVIIPAFNEENNLPAVLKDLSSLGQTIREIVVVDNASTDQTPEVAQALGATVLSEYEKGYGAACLRGLSYLDSKQLEADDVIAFVDGDYSDYPTELPDVVFPVINGKAELVIGSRLIGEESRSFVPPVARFGNAFACAIINFLYKVKFTDLGPMRAIKVDALQSLAMCDRNWGWTVEMQLKAARQGLKCTEVEVSYRKRLSGESKISGTVIGSLKAGAKILYVLGKHLLLATKLKPSRQGSAAAHRQALAGDE